MESVPVKRCTRCGEEKPATLEFFDSGGTRYPLSARCKACERVRGKEKHRRKQAKKLGVSPEEVFIRGEETPTAGKIMPDGTKWCSKCRTYKPATQEFFSRQRTAVTGFAYHCKACSQERARRAMAENKPGSVTPGAKRCCKGCGTEKPATTEFFYASRGNKTGLNSRCIECVKEWSANHRANNRPRVLESRRRYWHANKDAINLERRQEREENPELREAYNQKQKERRATRTFAVKIYGLRRRVARDAPWCEVPLTYQELQAIYGGQNGRCAYCLRDLSELEWEPDHVIPLSRTDLNPSNGPDNIVCACRKCNRNKSFKTLDEWYGRWYRLLPSTKPITRKRTKILRSPEIDEAAD